MWPGIARRMAVMRRPVNVLLLKAGDLAVANLYIEQCMKKVLNSLSHLAAKCSGVAGAEDK